MAIKINRFRVRYNGVSYGPGQEGGPIIRGLSDEEEASLILESRGTIEKYEVAQETVQTAAEVIVDEQLYKEIEESVQYLDEDNDINEDLNDVNIDDLVDPRGKKKRGK